jgi:hypothetical protein
VRQRALQRVEATLAHHVGSQVIRRFDDQRIVAFRDHAQMADELAQVRGGQLREDRFDAFTPHLFHPPTRQLSTARGERELPCESITCRHAGPFLHSAIHRDA